MASAHVIVNTELGKDSYVKEQFNKIPEITEVYHLYGIYDMVAKLEADTYLKIKNAVLQKMKKVNGVRSTMTLHHYSEPVINP